ncbi:MAG: FprA family A-type flavoprotein [Roseburia sp.]|nr:FprA family A-type flavoprotein [Roseburia sp.]
MYEFCENIFNVGVDDKIIDLFEGMYKVPQGVAYNSYVIKDEKTAVIDTVGVGFHAEWLKNIEGVLGQTVPDYLIVQHMEPDHSACIEKFVRKYPQARVVGNKKTFVMLEEYFGKDFVADRVEVNDGDELCLGKRNLKFVFAPMVHWPEVMFTYVNREGILFSADAFGKFGASDADEEWVGEARRYYIGIVGKYGAQVKAVLGKLSGYALNVVAPLHGPVLSGKALQTALEYYAVWSGYKPETNGVLVAYASVYGHTKRAACLLAELLKEGGEEVKLVDLARDDWAECVALAFAYSKLVIASVTYNGEIFPAAREFIDRLTERNYQNRTVAFIENGSWAPVCAKLMRARLEKCKNLTFAQTEVKVRSALNGESEGRIKALCEELLNL